LEKKLPKICLFFFQNPFSRFGYKNFVYNKRLYILIGDSNYLVFIIPDEIKLLCKKNQIFGISLDKHVLNNFFTKLQYLKKMNYYKGKGILKFRNFKFMKLKVGKKQKS
jgi:ribosomal protein L6P/L9E